MKKIIKKLTTALLGLSLLLPTVVFAQDKVIDKDKGVVIGLDDTFAPFGFRDEQGELQGFDIDLAEEALGRMGVEYEFQPIEWSMKETELNTGNIDMIWNSYSITDERKEVVEFSEPYMENRQIIVVLADSEIEKIADLDGKLIATQSESSSLDAINAYDGFKEMLGGDIVTYESFLEVFNDLDNKRVDAIVIDETMASYITSQAGTQDNYKILEEDLGDEDIAIGFRKSDKDFVDELNKTLQDIKDEGLYDEIKEKWFGNLAN